MWNEIRNQEGLNGKIERLKAYVRPKMKQNREKEAGRQAGGGATGVGQTLTYIMTWGTATGGGKLRKQQSRD